jgi:hypothetical protein
MFLALFIRLIIRTFHLVFSAGTVFFSHDKSVFVDSGGATAWAAPALAPPLSTPATRVFQPNHY